MDTRRPVSWLVAGRLAGLAGAIGIPMVLARTLAPAELGAYRQIFLVFTTLYAIAQLGMAESLYFFLPRRGESEQVSDTDAGQLVANSAVALGAAGVVCAALLTFAAHPIARAARRSAAGALACRRSGCSSPACWSRRSSRSC